MASSFDEAQARILALNSPELPFTYDPTPEGVRARWKYADVRWSNIIAAGSVDGTYELQVLIDAHKGAWRFRETSAQSQANVNPDGAQVRWSWHKGTVKRVSFDLGAAIAATRTDRRGESSGHVYGWKFTTDEVKAPVVKALTEAGYRSGNGFFSRLFGG